MMFVSFMVTAIVAIASGVLVFAFALPYDGFTAVVGGCVVALLVGTFYLAVLFRE